MNLYRLPLNFVVAGGAPRLSRRVAGGRLDELAHPPLALALQTVAATQRKDRRDDPADTHAITYRLTFFTLPKQPTHTAAGFVATSSSRSPVQWVAYAAGRLQSPCVA